MTGQLVPSLTWTYELAWYSTYRRRTPSANTIVTHHYLRRRRGRASINDTGFTVHSLFTLCHLHLPSHSLSLLLFIHYLFAVPTLLGLLANVRAGLLWGWQEARLTSWLASSPNDPIITGSKIIDLVMTLPCSVDRPTAHAPGRRYADRQRTWRPAGPPAVSVTEEDVDRRQTTTEDDRRHPAKQYWPIRRASNNAV